jgi:hypothetical protein
MVRRHHTVYIGCDGFPEKVAMVTGEGSASAATARVSAQAGVSGTV